MREASGVVLPSLGRSPDIAEIERIVKEKDIKLVLIDPLNMYIDGKTDVKMGPSVRAITTPLAKLAQDTGVAVVVVMHLNKGIMQQALYRISGSVDFVGAARSVLGVGFDPDSDNGRRLILPVKSNLGVMPDGIGYNIIDGEVVWDREPVTATVGSMLSGAQANEKSQSRLDLAKNLIAAVLARGEQDADFVMDVVKAAGISERTVKSALLGQRERGQVLRGGRPP
jgi:hypothetical protein